MDADDPKAYHNVVPGLAHIYLEDSFVLGLTSTADSLVFAVDLVLTEKHPEYQDPRPHEVYCYRRGKIIIAEANTVQWNSVCMRPSKDAEDVVEFGSIDAWSVDGNRSQIEGGWSEVDVDGGQLHVILYPDGDMRVDTSTSLPQ
jgi:hypothetical protein